MRLLAIILITLPLTAQLRTDRGEPGPWKRHVQTSGKGDYFDTPPPYPLAHFTKYPAFMQLTDLDILRKLSPADRLAAAKAVKARVAVHRVGAIHGLPIYDVFYYFEHDYGPAGAAWPPDWKSILVQTAPNAYREIYHCERTQEDARVRPSIITTVDKEPLLNSRYDAGGNKGIYSDDYYWFSPNGPTLVDFEPVWTAAQTLVPEKARLWRGGDFPETLTSMKITMHIWSFDSALCCLPGAVEVSFKLDNGRVIVTGTHFDPTRGWH